jgi:cytoskeletal protein RodZ
MLIGDQLRQARESQAISLDQAAQATHIRLHYLQALETNQFDSFPSSTQVRGFLRAYGDYLKLNTAELLQALDGDWKTSQVASIPTPITQESQTAISSSEAIYKEIGQTLRSQRELMGLSLGDVERHTHIRMHYVNALEEGDISHLPSPVQGRGMLSNYATFLGLNAESILLRFADGLQAGLYDRQVARGSPASKASQGEAVRTITRPSQLRRLFSVDLFTGGFLIIFLLGFTIWGALRISAMRSGQEPSPTAPSASELLLATPGDTQLASTTLLPTNASPTVLASVVETTLLPETTQIAEVAVTEGVQATPTFGTAPIQLYIVASQQAWLRVIVDGEVVFEDRTVPGSAYTFSGSQQVAVRTGNGGGLQVYFNQQDLGLLGAFGEVVERVYTIQGVVIATPRVPPTSTPAPTGTPTPSSTPAATSAPTATLATPRP